MKAEIEKSEHINNNFPQSENNLNQNKNKDINIIIPNEESSKKIKEVKKIKNNKNNNIEEKNKENNIESQKKLLKAYKRLDIQNLLNSDNFAWNYLFYPCKNEMDKFCQDQNYTIKTPYLKLFYDNILLRDESIFFIHDKTQKNKFMDETDIKKIKSENIKLDFGEDPCDNYYKILRENNKNKNELLLELQENINNFHVFKCGIPNYINIKMDDFKENELVKLRMKYNDNEEGCSKFQSLSSTKINSGNSIIENSLQLNENSFILNNEIYNNETNEDWKQKSDKKYINKKRKLKK